MLTIKKDLFIIETANTTYAMRLTDHDDIQHLYYGKKLKKEDIKALIPKRELLLVNSLYMAGDVSYGIDDMSFEYSFAHRGDSRPSACILRDGDSEVFDFQFDKIIQHVKLDKMTAASHDSDIDFTIQMKCPDKDIVLRLNFAVFYDSDVITRWVEVVNHSDKNLSIEKLMSNQLDLKGGKYNLITFDGAWARERYKTTKSIQYGTYNAGSLTGMSSPECNPFFIVAKNNCDNMSGECYAFNLVYSGSHKICVHRDTFEGIRIMNGIQDEGLSYTLPPCQSFVSPESVMTYSCKGMNGASLNMHEFVQKNIVAQRQIPVMLNTWEAMYFDMSEDKIKEIVDKAVDMGFESVVIDDGWFGERNDDTTSLGDWFVNKDKFPQGIKGIGDYCRKKGISLGIWFEPEMISVSSKLYSSHPDWALKNNDIRDITGRGQYILDMTKKEVRDYLYDAMSFVIEEGNIGYVKWDFNRRFAEIRGKSGGEYLHNYILGLYELLKRLNDNFPQLVIEGCASGGGRFDLGILCFCPFIWTSDNTNPLSRAYIQEGTSYGYPLSAMLNHVSASPNHQTKRLCDISTRSAVAMQGVFGCQEDITKLDAKEEESIVNAINEYKSLRKYLSFAKIYRLGDGFDENDFVWQIMYNDSEGRLLIYRKRFLPDYINPVIRLYNLDRDALYQIEGAGCKSFKVHGSTLEDYGFVMPQNYMGNNTSDDTTMLLDDTAVVYKLTKINN